MKRRALLSVFDKTGIVEFAVRLRSSDVEIVSTGGTYELLKSNDIEAIRVEDVTGYAEMLEGRVKTLHPAVFGAILADRSKDEHLSTLAEKNIVPIDIVAVNLYPFKETISAHSTTLTEAIEQIDIGGVSLIRAAAKNFLHVDVLTDPSQYVEFLERLNEKRDAGRQAYSRKLAAEAFAVTSAYDNLISNYLRNSQSDSIDSAASRIFPCHEIAPLRYGENPHQNAVLVKDEFDRMFEILHGKEISYNNMLDVTSACDLISDLEEFGTACVIVKHGNPSGVSCGSSAIEAFEKALASDPVSAFGGIVAFNRKLDFNTSLEVDKLFTEIIIAPEFEESALELLKKKKNRRLIRFNFVRSSFELRTVSGGWLIQEKDEKYANAGNLKFVTSRTAGGETIQDLFFAERVCKHVKSNAVVFVKGLQTLGIGAGQPSRIDSTNIAVQKAKQFGHDLSGSCAASDAFFPFSDGVAAIAECGAEFVIQPGGSVRDDEVIAEADKRGMAMAFTGIRHFKH